MPEVRGRFGQISSGRPLIGNGIDLRTASAAQKKSARKLDGSERIDIFGRLFEVVQNSMVYSDKTIAIKRTLNRYQTPKNITFAPGHISVSITYDFYAYFFPKRHKKGFLP
jgi:hypothetical protein